MAEHATRWHILVRRVKVLLGVNDTSDFPVLLTLPLLRVANAAGASIMLCCMALSSPVLQLH